MSATIRSAATALRVHAQPNDFGARISGVDLAAAAAAPERGSLFAELRALWLRYQVLAFPEQRLSNEALTAVTRCFGAVGSEPYLEGMAQAPEIVRIHRAATEQATPFGTSWHSDWSFQAQPPAATILYSRIVPPRGGDTCFADGIRAFDALDSARQAQLRTLTALHSARRSYSPSGYFATDRTPRSMRIRSDRSAYAVQEHPLIRTHPESGREALWVNPVYTIGIKELPGATGQAMLERLCAHSTQPEYVYRHQWEPDMLVIWDNRSVQHCATGGYDGYERLMHRTTVAGDTPH
ncbi:MAG: TauD/TfdA family dioxygenase [Pseudomonadota bacterium]